MTLDHHPCSTSSANGVYEPAISTKIIEWSRRFMRTSAAGDHFRRWYRALAPYMPDSDSAYTAAPTRAIAPAATTTTATPWGIEAKNAIWCSRPRSRGFCSTMAVASSLT